MPLARILTRNPERTAGLSSQLKQQGYSVEVARPDQTNLAPADLEIEFEVCERADVLDRAADLATELGADVAVAPGFCRCRQSRQQSRLCMDRPLRSLRNPSLPCRNRSFPSKSSLRKA